MKHSKILILTGALGYALCLAADFVLEFVNGARLTMESFVDYETFFRLTEGVSSGRFAVSGILGLCSMILIALGMVGLYELAKTSAPVLSEIVLIGGIGSAVLGGGFHILYTIEPWLFLTLGRSEEAFAVVQQFVSAHGIIFVLNPVFNTLMSVPLFIILVSKKTDLPRWSCVFNLVLLFFILNAFHVPGATSIAGILMCAGVFVLSILKGKKS